MEHDQLSGIVLSDIWGFFKEHRKIFRGHQKRYATGQYALYSSGIPVYDDYDSGYYIFSINCFAVVYICCNRNSCYKFNGSGTYAFICNTGILTLMFYTYPSALAKARSKNIEKVMPFATSYMSAISSGKVSIATLFKTV